MISAVDVTVSAFKGFEFDPTYRAVQGRRILNFDVVGPFVITRHGPKKLIDKQSCSDLRNEVETAWEGLSDACGCYVFAVRAGKGFTPFYAGQQACARPLVAEALNPANITKYNGVPHKKGNPVIFLLPMVTSTGRLRKRPENGKSLRTINFLEDWLIATCLVKNPDLINNRKTKILRNIHVTGILNARPGSGKNGASTALKRAIF
ncbi:hypothetical protein [Methylocystis heyeri]|uniref:Uncharacterized protein n=1 Tax=Methylocystis heyeri TaxID=391905 RepID=A0A6B8KBM6_9HYPH|nr:hypothetical protein [Methylocystis heyeri]QGM44455.1 hypothetical protein H2LOC_001370 [Methylocystis heyeri]